MEQRFQAIISIINETDCSSEILNLINVNKIREEAEIRRDWLSALQKVRVGNELSGKIRYNLSSVDLKKLALLHQANKCRKKIENLLTDCNFHYEAGQFAKRQYEEFLE